MPLHRLDDIADAPGGQRAGEEVEAVGHVEAAAVGVPGDTLAGPVAGDLAQQHGGAEAVAEPVERLQEQVVELRPRLVVALDLHRVGRAQGGAGHPGTRRPGRVAPQLSVMHAELDRVDPEAVHPRSSQNRACSSRAAMTGGSWKLRSGCSFRKLWR